MKTSDNSNGQLPNYRIYDLTGGGVTEDIYAQSLEDAIEQGRAWIEGGDWRGCGEDADVYRTIELECCVSEIVRYPVPDAAGNATAPDGTALHADEDGDLLDAEGHIYSTAADCGEIDHQATSDADRHDCSGRYSEPLPDCEMFEHAGGDTDNADESGHVWVSPLELVGGLRQNPGVWSTGGTSMSFSEVCRLCGCRKHTHQAGSQRNPGEPVESITLEDRDKKSEAWLKEIHADEDGFLPIWLAEYLDCSLSTKMTRQEAEDWARENYEKDDADVDTSDLEHAYAAICGRRSPYTADRVEDQENTPYWHMWSDINPSVNYGVE